MGNAFILRYQEFVEAAEGQSVQCATQTRTEAAREAADKDPRRASALAIPQRDRRQDKVRKADSAGACATVPTMATQTLTRVAREANDKDRASNAHRAIPRCSLS